MDQKTITTTRLRQAREAAGFKTAAEFANKHGFTETLYRSNENGHRTLTVGQARKYAPKLGVNWVWLMEGDGPSDKINDQKTTTRSTKVPPFQRHDGGVTNDGPESLLKVLGMAEGGPQGWNLWNGEIVQYITRPENLRGVPGAYAVYVTGHSMEPRYEPGELVHIHPGRPVLPGAYVLVQRKPLHDGDPPLAVLKRLVRRSGSKVVLEQLNPLERFDVQADQIISIHRVVGSSEA